MKKYLIIGLGIAILFVVGYYFFNNTSEKAEIVVFQDVAVKKDDIEVSFSTDALVAADIITVSAPFSEKIVKVNAKVGANIKKGQTLFTLDNSKLTYQYNQSYALYTKAIYERNQIDKEIKPDSYNSAQQVVNSAWNQVNIAKLALTQAVVTAPVTGTIAQVNIKEGEYPQGPSSAVTIIKNNTLYFEAFLDESEVVKISKTTVVYITLDSINKRVLGKIVYISPIPTTDSAGYSVYPVRISISDESLKIKVGFEGSVQFVTKTVKDVLQIPAISVFIENGKSYVYRKTDSDKEKVEVKTGFTDGKVVEIIDGLVLEDKVLIKK